MGLDDIARNMFGDNTNVKGTRLFVLQIGSTKLNMPITIENIDIAILTLQNVKKIVQRGKQNEETKEM